MLTEDQQRKIRLLCQRQRIGMVEFLPNGRIQFSAFRPIRDIVEATFPAMRIVDDGVSSWQSRPDEMKRGYWVIVEMEN